MGLRQWRAAAATQPGDGASPEQELADGGTDPLATTVWHERHVGRPSPSVESLAAARAPDIYVLTGDDLPFVQDGLRDGEHLRAWMTDRFRQVLDAQPAPWLEVRGTREQRVSQVLAALPTLASGPVSAPGRTGPSAGSRGPSPAWGR